MAMGFNLITENQADKQREAEVKNIMLILMRGHYLFPDNIFFPINAFFTSFSDHRLISVSLQLAPLF